MGHGFAEYDHLGLGGALHHFTVQLNVKYDEVSCGFKEINGDCSVLQVAPQWSTLEGPKWYVKPDSWEHTTAPDCVCVVHGASKVKDKCFTYCGEVTMLESTPKISIPTPFGTITLPTIAIAKVQIIIEIRICESGAIHSRKWRKVDDGPKEEVH